MNEKKGNEKEGMWEGRVCGKGGHVGREGIWEGRVGERRGEE